MAQAQKEALLNQGPNPNPVPSRALVLPEPVKGPQQEAHPPPPPSEPEAFYFTKEGRTLIHSQPPTAYAWGYPWPPCPTNLAKNKVFRPKEEELGVTGALPEQVVKEVVKEFKKESKPLGSEIEGKSLDRSMIPEIELALYWDRHPFEFRPTTTEANSKRSKSAQNLSQVAELLVQASRNESRRSSGCSSIIVAKNNDNHVRRSSSATCSSSAGSSDVRRSSKGSDYYTTSKNSPQQKNDHNQTANPKSESKFSNPRVPKILQVLSESEKRQFVDIHKPPITNGTNYYHQPLKVVRTTPPDNPHHNPHHRHRHHHHHNRNNNDHNNHNDNKSIGVQVTLDGVMAESLKSTYLCPLHGQYKRGVDRRTASGFRTDMTGGDSIDPHAHCSRGLKARSRSRTRLVKTAEVQTEDDQIGSGGVESSGRKLEKSRSKTAPGGIRRNINPNMISESGANFRHPGHIANAENRKLRNKILSYCFTKHSIF